MSSSEHKKKHEHRKKNTSLPPDVYPDGGLNSRIHGVPGSTPGCTAGAYAKSLTPEDLPEITLKTCFPDHYTAAKKWISEVRPKSLQLLLTAFGPAPTIADIVNKWLIRRVGRKCIEGTEEGRKDMEAFCVDVLKRLRKLPTCSMKLFRAVPWSAMGKLAPGLSEFEEETNIVWPTFSSLTKSESRARELLKDGGGILFVVQTDQARDVTDVASVHQEDGEFMLEPNSCFTINANKDEGKIFVVEMTQLFPSVRPIMKEVEDHKHHHHDGVRSSSADPLDPSFQMPQNPIHKPERSATVVTPVLRRVPSATNSPLGRKNSLNCVADFSSSLSSPGSPRFPRSSSRLAISQSPYKYGKPHRVQRNNLTTSMTMWSAARGYIRILSSQSRGNDHLVKPYTPVWASPDYREKKEKEEKEKKEKEELEKKEKEKEEGKDKEVKEDDEEKGKSKEKKKKKDKKKKGKEKEKLEEINTAAIAAAAAANGDDSWISPPVSPTTPGYGTMELYPESAPNYIVDDRTVDWQTIGGIILHSTHGTPLMVMSLK